MSFFFFLSHYINKKHKKQIKYKPNLIKKNTNQPQQINYNEQALKQA